MWLRKVECLIACYSKIVFYLRNCGIYMKVEIRNLSREYCILTVRIKCVFYPSCHVLCFRTGALPPRWDGYMRDRHNLQGAAFSCGFVLPPMKIKQPVLPFSAAFAASQNKFPSEPHTRISSRLSSRPIISSGV